MAKNKSSPKDLELLGGRLCLDFINTVDWRGREKPVEFLNEYKSFVAWGQHVKMFAKSEVLLLLRLALDSPQKAERVLRDAVELRETLYRLFSSTINSKLPQQEDIDLFNKHLSRTMARSKIVREKSNFILDSTGPKEELDRILNPIIRSASDLLTSPQDLKRVKTCADDECGWLFLDHSRNQSRRWCDMKDCGNRAKVSQYYLRKKLTRQSESSDRV